MPYLDQFFNPKSVAIIGASQQPGKVGAIVVENILNSGFAGKVFPINPKAPIIHNLTCYPDITTVPETPDLTMIAIPAPLVVPVMEQIGQKGCHNVVIFTAGFKETGTEGQELEKQLIEVAKKYQINILGPNCLGFVNNNTPINATFSQSIKHYGRIRFITQSGAIASSIFDWCEANNLGFNQFVTLGNKANLAEHQVLQYWLEQEQNNSGQTTDIFQPVGLYLESIVNGQEFLKVAQSLSAKHPLFVIKPGKSPAAKKAMQSHTGAIAGEDAVMDAAFEQGGLVRCAGLEDFFDLVRGFSWQPVPLGPNVAVISNAGGPAVISADCITEDKLNLAPLSNETKQKLLEVLPRAASIANPIDVLGDALAQRYADAMEIVLKEEQVHGLIVILTPQVMTQIEETAELIGNVAKQYQKPILCSFMGGSLVAKGEKILNEHKIPSFRYPERAIKTLASMWHWQNWRNNYNQPVTMNALSSESLDSCQTIITKAKAENRQTLDNFEASSVLTAAGIIVPKSQAIYSPEEALSFANQSQYPVVLKLISPNLLHKTESGGVMINLDNQEKLTTAYHIMQERINTLDEASKIGIQIQIQQQIKGGIEIIAGVKRDPTFGPVLMFGAGGTLAELIADRNLHILPINQAQAENLIKHAKVYKLLAGFRGDQPYDVSPLAKLLVQLGTLATQLPEIAEIEINPVIMTHEQVWAVDGKVVLTK